MSTVPLDLYTRIHAIINRSEKGTTLFPVVSGMFVVNTNAQAVSLNPQDPWHRTASSTHANIRPFPTSGMAFLELYHVYRSTGTAEDKDAITIDQLPKVRVFGRVERAQDWGGDISSRHWPMDDAAFIIGPNPNASHVDYIQSDATPETGGTFTFTVTKPGGAAVTATGIDGETTAASMTTKLVAMSNVVASDFTCLMVRGTDLEDANAILSITWHTKGAPPVTSASFTGLTGGTDPVFHTFTADEDMWVGLRDPDGTNDGTDHNIEIGGNGIAPTVYNQGGLPNLDRTYISSPRSIYLAGADLVIVHIDTVSVLDAAGTEVSVIMGRLVS